MKRFILGLFAAITMFATGCEGFDDSAIWDKLNSLEGRVKALEQLCSQMNTNISALQTIVEALQKNDYVTNIAPIKEGDKVIGYTISFNKSDSITIYHGKDGENGKDGVNGTNGTNGKDGHTPQIGVKKDVDGIYYWVLDGEWLLDDEGNKIKAEGRDGKDGEDGEDGVNGTNGTNGTNGKNGNDGITPKLKIENGYWYVSYDNGVTWSEVGKATGEDGEDGNDGDSMFEDITYDDDYVYITLADGTTLVLPRSVNSNEIPNNEIWYTTTNGSAITLTEPNAFGVKIISNVYEKSGRGIITFDGDVTSIGEEAFYRCFSLTSITLPNGVTSIGEEAFYLCFSLTSITLPNGVTSIGEEAFYGCSSLTSITIPDSVTSVGELAFEDCSSLTAFYGESASADNRCLIIKGKLVAFAPNGLTSYTIPDGVPEIGDFAFYGCSSLTSITLPDGVTEIGDCAFSDCLSLINITLPDGITLIGVNAFSYCSSLDNITIPESVTSIGDYALTGCYALKILYIKNPTPPTINSSAVDDCNNLSKIYVPSASVDAYKSANGWKEYASKIEGYNFNE